MTIADIDKRLAEIDGTSGFCQVCSYRARDVHEELFLHRFSSPYSGEKAALKALRAVLVLCDQELPSPYYGTTSEFADGITRMRSDVRLAINSAYEGENDA